MATKFNCDRCKGPYKGTKTNEDSLKLCAPCGEVVKLGRVRARALGSVARKLGEAYRLAR